MRKRPLRFYKPASPLRRTPSLKKLTFDLSIEIKASDTVYD